MVIDLDNEEAEVLDRPDLSTYIGGVALGLQLLKEHGFPEEEALNPQQPIIYTKGPLNTVFPVVTKTCSLFKSPLTGELGESYVGMRFSMAMGMAGLDGLVIKGKANRPIILKINNHSLEIKEGHSLWGLNTDETTRLLHDQPGRRGLRSILVIGEAGEKNINFACVTVDTYRHFGRLGLGAVMGSKGIKGIIVEGDQSQIIDNPKKYNKVYEEIYHRVNETDLMEKYHGVGTSININALNDIKALPTHNFKDNCFEFANEISGETFAKDHLIKKVACSGCTIGCIHIALLRQKYGDSHEYQSSTIAYDHELIYSLGSMLGVGNPEELMVLIETVELMGLDAMTTGVLLAWITEAYEKGYITEKETIEKPQFGNAKAYHEMIKLIVKQPNLFYKQAAKGTHYLAEKYGGKDFAMVLGKNEVAGYHTGYGNLIGQAVGGRHSHLDNAGYSFDQEKGNIGNEELVKKLIQEEIDRNLLNSLVICLFARKIYDYPTVIAGLEAIGQKVSLEDLKKLATKTFIEKIALKEKMGFSYDEIHFPKRFFETMGGRNKLNAEEAHLILDLYKEEIKKIRHQN